MYGRRPLGTSHDPAMGIISGHQLAECGRCSACQIVLGNHRRQEPQRAGAREQPEDRSLVSRFKAAMGIK